MSSLIEWAKKQLGRKTETSNKVVVPEVEPEWTSFEGFQFREWESRDGKRKIVTTICGGREYGGTYRKDVRLRAIGEIASGDMMRVQAVLRPEDSEVKYSVYLDAITQMDDGTKALADVAYFGHGNGKMEEPICSWSRTALYQKFPNLSHQEFEKLWISELRAEGVYDMSEIRPEIDIEATVEGFIDQIKRSDLSKPKLYPKRMELRTGEE